MRRPFKHDRSATERRDWWRVFFVCVAVIAMTASVASNALLLTLSHQNHTILTSAQSAAQAKVVEDKKLSDAGKEQLAFAAHILAVEDVICIKLHQINPGNPQCPALTDLPSILGPKP